MSTQNKKPIKTIISLALAITLVIIIINTVAQNAAAWYIADALYVIIPIVFTITCIRKRGAWPVAVILWIPALIVAYMASIGFLGIDHPLWLATNMWQLITYSYFIGTRLKIRP